MKTIFISYATVYLPFYHGVTTAKGEPLCTVHSHSSNKELHKYAVTTCILAKMPRLISS